MPSLSIIIPVYNEIKTFDLLLKKVDDVVLINDLNKDIILIDDGSTDGTRDLLKNLDKNKYKVLFHDSNQGKGAAIRTGLKEANGDWVVIQDADLEYDPNDYNLMLEKMIVEDLSVVYGSRELKRQDNRYSSLTFYWGGLLVTWVGNLLFGQKLTDEATCYKMFKTDFLKSLPLRCKKFEFCPEVTALVSLRGIKISEVGIAYFPRPKSEGKKIRWRDGVEAVWTFIKYRFKI